MDASELVGKTALDILNEDNLYTAASDVWTPVPEPATLALLLLGGLVVLRRRRSV